MKLQSCCNDYEKKEEENERSEKIQADDCDVYSDWRSNQAI
jgi:hypothetical protein